MFPGFAACGCICLSKRAHTGEDVAHLLGVAVSDFGSSQIGSRKQAQQVVRAMAR